MPDKTKILLVDDSPDFIKVMRDLISADDVEIHSFTNVDNAVASLSDHEYGLAILDMQMPDINRFELSKASSTKKNAHFPIIFVTDLQDNATTVLKGYETGAIDLLFKPLNPYIVRSKVRVFVELQHQRHLMQVQLQELERLSIAAESASVAKSQFLANMSHEIRTPLAAVMGFADLIARGEVSKKEIDECASSIRRNGNLLLHLIDDVLDLSKIEANRLELENQNYPLIEVLEDIESTLTLKAREKGIELYFRKLSLENNGHIFDPIRIKQILLNIIGNAIKFSTKGEVLVNVEIHPVSSTHDRLSVIVKNEGVGFSQEQAERLFRPFGQADPSIKREYGGSGLGLIISRQLARAMGGDVVILKSEIDVGTEMEVTAVLERSLKSAMDPLALRKTTFETDQLTKTFPGKHILLVDDARDNLILLEMFLRGTQAKLTMASNGLEAYELCQNHKFDMILMDIQMPKMDGHEATSAIRLLGQKMPIIALTAHASKEEYNKCRKAGCNDALVKPFSKNNLIKALHHYFE